MMGHNKCTSTKNMKNKLTLLSLGNFLQKKKNNHLSLKETGNI